MFRIARGLVGGFIYHVINRGNGGYEVFHIGKDYHAFMDLMVETKGRVLSNMRNLVMPYLEKLKKSELDDTQEIYLDILESNLSEIISPFSSSLSSKFINLTHTEIRVANLVKQGKSTKEIAGLMNSSPRTVEAHRENIRKKLNIKNIRINLRSYLSLVE